MTFSAASQCHWCGTDNTKGVVGYGGERSCPRCGWGGEGEPDVPCMFYKIITTPKWKPPETGNRQRKLTVNNCTFTKCIS